jgi:hypothetical protein
MMTSEATFLSEADVARVLHVARRTIQRWREVGGGPPYTRVGERRIVYAADALRRWADARTYPHRAAELHTTARSTPPSV